MIPPLKPQWWALLISGKIIFWRTNCSCENALTAIIMIKGPPSLVGARLTLTERFISDERTLLRARQEHCAFGIVLIYPRLKCRCADFTLHEWFEESSIARTQRFHDVELINRKAFGQQVVSMEGWVWVRESTTSLSNHRMRGCLTEFVCCIFIVKSMYTSESHVSCICC
jgi:hypothetical protein